MPRETPYRGFLNQFVVLQLKLLREGKAWRLVLQGPQPVKVLKSRSLLYSATEGIFGNLLAMRRAKHDLQQGPVKKRV